MTRLDKITRLAEKAEAKTAKRTRKKDELADHAITALKHLGYARTSLRDIAELSGVAVGTLHYYFEDKVDLIIYCVRRYKADFATEMNALLDADGPPEQMARRVIEGLSETIRANAEVHRLWYDIRSQAMFDPDFREVVEDIETALIALVSNLLLRMERPLSNAEPVYLALDAAFRYHLQKYLAGDPEAPRNFERQVEGMLKSLA